jgi:hypothetical protein
MRSTRAVSSSRPSPVRCSGGAACRPPRFGPTAATCQRPVAGSCIAAVGTRQPAAGGRGSRTRLARAAFLKDGATGKDREVDLVIRSRTAAYGLTISVESTAGGRTADVGWVEQLIQKHAHLPTDKLVLVSESGFTDGARDVAEHHNVITLAPRDLSAGDAATEIVNRLPSLWPKLVGLNISDVTVELRHSTGEAETFRIGSDLPIYDADDRVVGSIKEWVETLTNVRLPELTDFINVRELTADVDDFIHTHQPAEDAGLYLRSYEFDPPELERILDLCVTWQYRVRVAEVPLRHRQLGETRYSEGQAQIDGHTATIVVTEDASGSRISVRMRPQWGPIGDAVGFRPDAGGTVYPVAPGGNRDMESGPGD